MGQNYIGMFSWWKKQNKKRYIWNHTGAQKKNNLQHMQM